MDTNVLYFGDNLDVLRNHIDKESVDLVYLDPPFNSNRTYNVLFSESSGHGSGAQMEAFEDTWEWGHAAQLAYEEVLDGRRQRVANMLRAMVEGLGHNPVTAYLAMMAIRLTELDRVLKPTGSIYLHCDPTAGHYLKVLMDAVFDPRNFRNEIIWKRTSGHSDARRFGRVHDAILFYAKGPAATWNATYQPYDATYIEQYYRYSDDDGRRWMSGDATAAGLSGGGYEYEWKGVRRVWRFPEDTMRRLDAEGRIFYTRNGIARVKRYLDESAGLPAQDVWTDIEAVRSWHTELLEYPTQKPLGLLERIIAASSNPGDVVLDPFCGCGTAIHAAQNLDRRWIGIDITHLAIGLIRRRLQNAFPGIEVDVVGEPRDLAGAAYLASTRPTQFEYWVIDEIDARATGGRGPDLDGVIPFFEFGRTPRRAVVSVKGTRTVNPAMIRELEGCIDEDRPIGILVTLTRPTKGMERQAAAAGSYEVDGRKYPRIQILTVEEILDGARPKTPPRAALFASAPTERERAEKPRLL